MRLASFHHPSRTLALWVTSALLVVVGIQPAAAEGAGLGYSLESDRNRHVVGAGSWAVVGTTTVSVAFECQLSATPDPVSTSVWPPEDEGCVLKRNGQIIARALGRTLPGPFVATSGSGSFPLFGTSSVEVCWSGHASFLDGESVATSDCSDIGLLDTQPLPSLQRGAHGQAITQTAPLDLCGGEDCDYLVYACVGHGFPAATEVEIMEPDNGGCVLRQGGVTIDSAPARRFAGPAAVSSASHFVVNPESEGPVEVCWHVRAHFDDGSTRSDQGCSRYR